MGSLHLLLSDDKQRSAPLQGEGRTTRSSRLEVSEVNTVLLRKMTEVAFTTLIDPSVGVSLEVV